MKNVIDKSIKRFDFDSEKSFNLKLSTIFIIFIKMQNFIVNFKSNTFFNN